MSSPTGFKRTILLAGALLAFLIGSGVATGQEVMQYYSPYGFHVLGTAATIVVVLVIANFGYAWAGKYGNITKGSDVFAFYCGPLAGKLFDIFTVIFCYMSYVVMVAGAGATLHQQYNLPLPFGAATMVVLACGTVVFGLTNIVNVIGKIAPGLIFCIFLVCLISLLKNMDGVVANIDAINSGALPVTKAGTNWFTSGASNGGFCILWLASFTAALGIKEDFKTLMKANVISAIVLVIVNMTIGFAILSKMGELHASQIPNLILAAELWEPLAYFFGILIFAAIYTTACPLLWIGSSRFTVEGSKAFKLFTVVLAVIGFVVALYVPFNILMNYIYVINGYLGFIILGIMIIRMVPMMRKRSKGQ